MATAKKERKRRNPVLVALKWIVLILLAIILIGVCTSALLARYAINYIDEVIMPQAGMDYTAMSLDQTSVIYYTDPSTGQTIELQTLYQEENRIWVEYSDIPRNLINATVAVEDKRFWEHPGVDWKRTVYGVLSMFTGQDIQGGSTLTQQLIKNLTQKDEVTVKRKILEIFRALEFEKRLGSSAKDTIIHWYLNTIYLGEQCYGVGTAAEVYFGKDVSELTLAECASLIGITNNPAKYDPYLSTMIAGPREEDGMWTTKQWNKYRQELILRLMLEQGYITQSQYNEAVAQELVFQRAETGEEENSSNSYTWFVDALINDLIADFMDQMDCSEDTAKQLLYRGGYQIYTTFNPEIQAVVDEIYENRENLNYASKTTGQQLQSAITVIDNETGAVVALSGGIGEKTGSRSFVRATQAHRQPGSSIKPISVYAPALDVGLITPSTIIEDSPFGVINGSIWPSNAYSGYRGRMTVRNAVVISSNTVAVKVLDKLTPEYSYEFLVNQLGFSDESIIAARTAANGEIQTDIGLAQLALGGLTNGATTKEMAAAFAIFPRNGEYIEPYLYTRVVSSDGAVVLENTSARKAVIKQSTAYYINSMLKDVLTASGGTGTEGYFSGMTIAGKTGTTTSKKDRWFVGYSPYYTAAVWVGYDKPERVDVSGNPAASLWKKVMQPLHEGLESKPFPQTVELTTAEYCIDCGLKAIPYCSQDMRGSRVATGTYVSGDAPAEYCQCHDVPVAICAEDPILDADGAPTGMFRIAGEFCPEECKIMISPLADRTEDDPTGFTSSDARFYKSWLVAQGTCLFHTEEMIQPTDTPEPSDDPLVSESPGVSDVPPDVSTTPGGSQPPVTSPSPPVTVSPQPSTDPNTMPPFIDVNPSPSPSTSPSPSVPDLPSTVDVVPPPPPPDEE